VERRARPERRALTSSLVLLAHIHLASRGWQAVSRRSSAAEAESRPALKVVLWPARSLPLMWSAQPARESLRVNTPSWPGLFSTVLLWQRALEWIPRRRDPLADSWREHSWNRTV